MLQGFLHMGFNLAAGVAFVAFVHRLDAIVTLFPILLGFFILTKLLVCLPFLPLPSVF